MQYRRAGMEKNTRVFNGRKSTAPCSISGIRKATEKTNFMTSLNKITDAELNGIFPFSFLHKLINIA